MIALLLAVRLSCPVTKIINETKYPWNPYDQQTLNHAKNRCGQIYHRSPCVKKFFKVGEINYQVICGAN